MTTTTIYLAASFNQQERMRAFRDVLQSFNGIALTSRWIDVHGETSMQDREIRAEPDKAEYYGQEDLDDIDRADIFIMFSDTSSTSGGRHTELGYALAREKVIFIAGPRENVFQALSQVMHFDTQEEIVTYMFGTISIS